MGASPKDREILVTNDDPSLTYVGEWSTVQASLVNGFGNWGSALSPTLHSTSTISRFSFPFNGSSINVHGSINIANSSTDPNPTWQCLIDGVGIGPPNVFNIPENNWLLCGQGSIPDGAHELVVDVTSQGMPFYLDFLVYQPSASVSLENKRIVMENVDPTVDYISGWSALGTVANQTTDPEGLVNVTFVGTQLSWYGIIQNPPNASLAEYSVDGQPFVPFRLAGLSSPSVYDGEFNQLFFSTPSLDMGTHTVSVRYAGSPGQTPFSLDYLIVSNGSFPSISFPSNVSSPSSEASNSHISIMPYPTQIASVDHKRSPHVATLAGSVVGAIGGLILCLITIFLWHTKRKRNDRNIAQRSIIEPFRLTSFPTNHTASTSSTPLASSQETPAVRVRIQDSGIRLPGLPEKLVELPPVYSERDRISQTS